MFKIPYKIHKCPFCRNFLRIGPCVVLMLFFVSNLQERSNGGELMINKTMLSKWNRSTGWSSEE